MNLIAASLVILFIAVLCVPLAARLRLPLEIFLFIGSCLLGFMPGLPMLHIDPNIVFNLFLPPILFGAAYFTSWRDFKANIRPIAQLAIGLVIFTTIFVAIAAKWLIPFLTWPEAFLLGAIVSPTDASAATAILKKFKVPSVFLTILEGESLVNDATALTLYRFCLTAILTQSFSLLHMTGAIVMLGLGGALIGYVIAYVAVFLLRRIQHTHAETVFTFLVAFSTYSMAEHLGFSGVIATVVGGIYFGIKLPQLAQSATRINAKATWGAVLFVINGFIFALIGFELPLILNVLSTYSALLLVTYGLVLTVVVMGLRIIWIFPSAYLPRKLFPALGKKSPMPRSSALFAIGWCGVRGIISLAAVLAIPGEVGTVVSASHLELITFLVYFIVVFTLIIPAFTLPSLLRFLHLIDVEEEQQKIKEEAAVRIKVGSEALAAIKAEAASRAIDPEIAEHLLRQMERRARIIETNLNPAPFSSLPKDFQSYKLLALAAIRAERDALLRLRQQGELQDEIFWVLSDELDIEEMRANTVRI